MMKGAKEYAVAVRRPDGSIQTDLFPYVSVTVRHKILSLPFIRGIISFVESLYIGMKTLMYSADLSMEEMQEEAQKTSPAAEKLMMTGTVIAAVLLALALFIVLPSLLASLVNRVVQNLWIVNLLEGLIRMLIFLGYIVAISRMKDIQRVFQYHGAEHKTINCYESGSELTPENAVRCTRLNRRCGTSFLFLVMLISILFFMLIPVSHPLYRILYRLLLIPVVAAVSYEVLKLSNRSQSRLITILVYPGLLLQKLTTKEPDIQQLEVAIASFKAVLYKETQADEDQAGAV